MRKLLTGQAAMRLGVSAVYVRQLADRGKLPVEKTIGGYRLFNEDDIEKLAAERRQLKKINETGRKKKQNGNDNERN